MLACDCLPGRLGKGFHTLNCPAKVKEEIAPGIFTAMTKADADVSAAQRKVGERAEREQVWGDPEPPKPEPPHDVPTFSIPPIKPGEVVSVPSCWEPQPLPVPIGAPSATVNPLDILRDLVEDVQQAFGVGCVCDVDGQGNHAPLCAVQRAQQLLGIDIIAAARREGARRIKDIHFHGDTYSPALDQKRLTRQYQRVFDVMCDGKWRTLEEIAAEMGAPQASISARLRDMRKPVFGAHTVNRKRRGTQRDGHHEYQLIIKNAGGAQ